MLRPTETIQKLLISSPANFVAEFEADDFVLTHAWEAKRTPYNAQSPLFRRYFALSFTTPVIKKASGVSIPDYSPTGDFICSLMSVLFGKRFDHHGPIEMTGKFHVPDLASAGDLCDPVRPYHGPEVRADYAVPLDLRELRRLRPLIEGETVNIKLSEAFRVAALFYGKALRSVTRDPEVAYLHLITACERLAEIAPLDEIELEAEIKTAFARIEVEMSDGSRIVRMFRKRLRQLKRRFAALIMQHLDNEFFARSEAQNDWDALKAIDFPNAAAAAYDLRSRYVHTGVSFGSWIAPRYDNPERQAGRPIVEDREMARILHRAPTFIGLERLTRLVLLKCAEQLGATLPDNAKDSATANQSGA